MTDSKTPAVPDIWYKAQRALRTGFAVLTTLLTFWGGFQLIAPQILAELSAILPGSWIIWLTSAIALITLVASTISRIMAIPAVNDFLTRFGLGSVPKKALVPVAVAEGGEVHVVAAVKPDPKAEVSPAVPPGGAVG